MSYLFALFPVVFRIKCLDFPYCFCVVYISFLLALDPWIMSHVTEQEVQFLRGAVLDRLPERFPYHNVWVL